MAKKYTGDFKLDFTGKINLPQPWDDRDIVTTKNDLLTLENAYPLIKVKVEEDGNTYQWVGGAQNDLSNWVDEVTVIKNGLSAITKGEGLVFETRAAAIAAPITPDELDPFTVYNESGFNGQYAFTSGNADGYILISLFVNQAEVGDSMEGSSKYFDGDKTINRIREELFDAIPTNGSANAVESGGVKAYVDDKGTSNINDADQTKFAQTAMVKAEQVARVDALALKVQKQIIKGSNVFDKNLAETGKNMGEDVNGLFYYSSATFALLNIDVESYQNLTFSISQDYTSIKKYAFLDADDALIGSMVEPLGTSVTYSSLTSYTLAIPSNATTLKMVVSKNSSTDFGLDYFIATIGTEPIWLHEDYTERVVSDISEYNENVTKIEEIEKQIYKQTQPNTNKYLFTEKLRPQFHLTPICGFMNDPIGLCYKDGLYHVFYQSNEITLFRDNQEWGHAVSIDLINWEHRRTSIPRNETHQMWSGSIYVDHNNVSGLGDGVMIAYLTETVPTTAVDPSVPLEQSQAIYYSIDDGESFERYGTFLTAAQSPTAPNIDFRDPKVVYDPVHDKYIFAINCYNKIAFYESTDLLNWTYTSVYDYSATLPFIAETANFYYDYETGFWVLIVAYAGSLTGYWIGSWDGTTFTPTTAQITQLDGGYFCYAGQVFTQTPNNKNWFIGWANTDTKTSADSLTKREGWAGILTLPRELNVKNVTTTSTWDMRLIQTPIDLSNYQKLIYSFKNEIPASTTKRIYRNISQSRVKCTIDLNVNGSSATYPEIQLLAGKDTYTIFQYGVNERRIFPNRSNSGYIDSYNGNLTTPIDGVDLIDNKLILDIYIDKCLIEVFIGDRRISYTSTVFPYGHELGFKTNGAGSMIVDCEIYDIDYTLHKGDDWFNTTLKDIVFSNDFKLAPQGVRFICNDDASYSLSNIKEKSANIDFAFDFLIDKWKSPNVNLFAIWGSDAEMQNYYKLHIDSDGNVNLIKSIEGVETQVGTVSQSINLRTLHSINVVTETNSIEVFYNDVSILTASENTLPSGRIGLGCQGYGGGYVQNLIVR